MFRAFLGVGGQFGGQALIFFFVATARARAGNGAVKSVAALYLEQHFRRAADDRGIVKFQKIHVGRRIHDAQRAINFKRIGGGAGRKTLAERHLKNISGANVFLRLAYGGNKFGVRKIRCHAQRRTAHPCWPVRLERRRELPPRLANFAHRGVIFRAQAAISIGENVADDPDAVADVVENHQAQIKHHYGIVHVRSLRVWSGMRSNKRTMSYAK